MTATAAGEPLALLTFLPCRLREREREREGKKTSPNNHFLLSQTFSIRLPGLVAFSQSSPLGKSQLGSPTPNAK